MSLPLSHDFHATAFLGITIDGHIARADGSINYLPPAPTGTSEEHAGSSTNSSIVPTITDMLATMDILVLGRATYETVLKLRNEEHEWPYRDLPVLALSRQTPVSLPVKLDVDDTAISFVESIEATVQHVVDKGYKKVWIDGGQTVRSFLEAGLLDELVLTTVPVVLGKGISLFAGLQREMRCEVMGVRRMERLVGVRYKVVYGEIDERGRLVT
ncbi:uncharacterized protein Z518_05231 [Rhinocladiella mackenziei CBS 650.93]|uniref:2,5-diamino-6-ribosylamino-4(3H)-pyrimidinone 5'-phosphate reductase n=1 Tax=Rhinocladiella mackenziei CBS 650.93 TaxID=1442369 RepID=A0A0D2H1N0_9EURO|nr:uncharacterized protein Z518_05231 [Rhinocladiella mackenziei CBS 650.93]KIX04363.1 hypothetical protein Z518_05231 [Rhinocladiella mackenziei CBS 650.93]